MKATRYLLPILFTVAGCASTPPTKTRAPAAQPYTHGTLNEKQTLAACNTLGWTDVVTPEQQRVINAQFSRRAQRLQQALWYAVRGGLNAGDSEQVIQAYGSPWGTAHPLCPAPAEDPRATDYNPVGEDFLYLQHQMSVMLKAALTAAGQKCVRGWEHVPDPKDWPIPEVDDSGAKSTAALTRLREWDAYLSNTTWALNWMRGLSLSQLGWALEFTMHNTLLLRYSTERPEKVFRSGRMENDGTPVPLTGVFPRNWIYDHPRNNWLADPYSAAVNPLFWKINGYIDHTLELWLKANSKSRISEDCAGDLNCYEWRGVWIGTAPATRTSKARASQIDPTLNQAFNRWRLSLHRATAFDSAQDPLTSAKSTLSCP